MKDVVDQRRLTGPGDPLEERNHLPLIELTHVETQATAHHVRPLAHVLLEFLVVKDLVEVGGGNVVPVLDVGVVDELLIEVLARDDGRVQSTEILTVVRVEFTCRVTLDPGTVLLADEKTVLERPGVSPLFDRRELGVDTVGHVARDVSVAPAFAGKVPPVLELFVFRGEGVHEGEDLVFRAPGAGPVPER